MTLIDLCTNSLRVMVHSMSAFESPSFLMYSAYRVAPMHNDAERANSDRQSKWWQTEQMVTEKACRCTLLIHLLSFQHNLFNQEREVEKIG